MKIAIPTSEGKLCMHFGHCEVFTIFNVNEKTKKVESKETKTPPPHEPGVLPRWLGGLGVNVMIAGGMGMRAQELFTSNNVKVVVGASVDNPEDTVKSYLAGTLVTRANVCDH